jgi:quercetin dioxygenase-like cupin family protein
MSEDPRAPIAVRLTGAESDGHLAVVTFRVDPDGSGPPLHVHPHHAEGFYVLEGEVTFQVGDDVVAGGAGAFFFARPGVPHTFANFSSEAARLLVLCTPAGFEGYFERLAAGQPGEPREGWAIAVGPPLNARGAS